MNNGLYPNPAVRRFEHGPVTLVSGLLFNVPHGLGRAPETLRAVLVMGETTEHGFATGDEIDVANVSNFDGFMAFTVGSTASMVFVSSLVGTTLYTVTKTGTGPSAITTARWKLKVYAS